jgi:hypothetical protein
MEQIKKAGTFQFIENWKIDRVNKETGEILDSQEFCNLIVNAGLTRAALLLNGNSSTYFRALAVGTGVTGAANGDTALETEVTRSAATLTNGTYTTIFAKTFTFGGDYAITEAGIFDSATVSGSTMLARTVFAAKNVSTTVSLIVTATITCARV